VTGSGPAGAIGGYGAGAAGAMAIELCIAEGFALAGVCRAEPSSQGAEFDAWLAAGKHGSMSYLAKDAAKRKNALLELATARSVVMVGLQYAERGEPAAGATAQPMGQVARYARGEDYHELIKQRLRRVTAVLAERFPGAEFRKFVDNSPFMEREHAVRAGLGWTGKHTLVIHPQNGSYFALGGFLTSIEMTPPAAQRAVADACGTCTRCIDACPTGAIEPYKVDGSRCIAYLTIERREMVPDELRRQMGDWIFGCDICQEVCPHNGPSKGHKGLANRDGTRDRDVSDRIASVPLLDLLGWTPADRAARLRDTAMKRARLEMLRRNAVIALGNWLRTHDDPAAKARLTEVAADGGEHSSVRETAAAVLADLKENGRGV